MSGLEFSVTDRLRAKPVSPGPEDDNASMTAIFKWFVEEYTQFRGWEERTKIYKHYILYRSRVHGGSWVIYRMTPSGKISEVVKRWSDEIMPDVFEIRDALVEDIKWQESVPYSERMAVKNFQQTLPWEDLMGVTYSTHQPLPVCPVARPRE